MLFLTLLFLKHYFVDFVLQTDEMIKEKGIYGSWGGINHSTQHYIFTLLIAAFFVAPWLSVALALLDGFLHYHIDWFKMNYGNRDITNKLFWNHLGLDQLAHSLTYIGLVCLV